MKTQIILATFVVAASTWSCGTESAFTEARSTVSTSNVDAQGKRNATAGAQDTEASANATKAGGAASNGAGGAGEGAGGDPLSRGGTEGGGTEGDAEAENPDGPIKTGDEDLVYGEDPDTTLVEDGGTLDLPGAKVAKVGINFEDLPNGDFDFNDAVLCFNGFFKVYGSQIVSFRKQTIVATTFSASGCSHRIDVRIENADGTVRNFSYSSKAGEPVAMDFDLMSKLEVTMNPTENTGTCSNGTTTMHDPTYARVLFDTCNNSGN